MSRITVITVAIAVLSVVSLAHAAFDERILVGEWAAYDSSFLRGASYTYFRLDERLNGVYAYAYNGDTPVVVQFSASDVAANEGFVVVTLRRNGGVPFKLVLSAFRTKSDGASLATGALYMYQSSGDQVRLFNTIFVRMTPVKDGDPLDSKTEIHQLRNLR